LVVSSLSFVSVVVVSFGVVVVLVECGLVILGVGVGVGNVEVLDVLVSFVSFSSSGFLFSLS